MYILGVLSLIQILILPGLILLKLFRFPQGLIQKIVYAFGLSLVFNQLYVITLTHLKINFPIVHYFLFGLELILFIYLYAADLKKPVYEHLNGLVEQLKLWMRSFLEDSNSQKGNLQATINLLLTIFFISWSIVSIFWSIDLLIDNFGSVFTRWDSVVSWNHWAVKWYSNIHPQDTYRYPQLIPANFSITYSFMRSSTIQFFAKGFMPFFAVYFLLLIFDLGLTKKNYAYFAGVVVSQYLLKRFYSSFIGSGYVDVPLIFFTFLSVQTLLKISGKEHEQEQEKYVFIGFIFAAGTALVKQNGLFVFGIYPFLAYLFIFKNLTIYSYKDKFRKLAIYFGMSIAIILPWYLFNELRILSGAKTNVLLLASQEHHAGRTIMERLIKAFKDLSIYIYLYPLLILSIPFLEKNIRKLVLFILIPYSLTWAFFFSLYTRNLSIGFALLGLAAGHSIKSLIDLGFRVFDKINIEKTSLAIMLIVFSTGLWGGQFLVPDYALIKKQYDLQRYALDPDVNDHLYQYFESKGDLEPIFTNYPLRFLPGFENKQIDIGGFEDYNYYKQKRDQFPQVRYMLIALYKNNGEVVNEIYEEIAGGRIQIIFEVKRYLFVEILQY